MSKTNKTNNLPITSWSEDDRPREKLLKHGISALSDAELIAILLGSGNATESAVDLAKRILSKVDNNLNALGKADVDFLMTFKGIGTAKAISIVAALELGRRRRASDVEERKKITSSRDVYNYFYPQMADIQHEEFWVMYLNRSNGIIDARQISRGGVSGTVVDARLIFKEAISRLASSVILCHNHPSGNINPSSNDINLTNKLLKAGKLLDIPVLDHLIIGDEKYYSFADEGMLT